MQFDKAAFILLKQKAHRKIHIDTQSVFFSKRAKKRQRGSRRAKRKQESAERAQREQESIRESRRAQREQESIRESRRAQREQERIRGSIKSSKECGENLFFPRTPFKQSFLHYILSGREPVEIA